MSGWVSERQLILGTVRIDLKEQIMKTESGQLSQWAETRKMGRSQWIWRYGVGYWGLTMAIFWFAFTTFMDGFRQIPLHFVIAFLLFPIAGYLWGMITWRVSETKFQKQYSLPKEPAADSNG